ncbi:MAG: rubredoxin [Ruthenibacterium sp.]
MKKYVCTICGYLYDEAAGIPASGIAPGTAWEQLPEGWVCPLCGAAKSEFKCKDAPAQAPAASAAQAEPLDADMREMSVGEVSALCSNLARGCEKQYMGEESALFTQLADYFKSKTPKEENASTQELLALVQKDLETGLADANAAAGAAADRGALRALVWSEKVTRILNSLLARYEKEGDAFLAGTNVYVCGICGFVYIGDAAPALCPVCKVPDWKFLKIERR